jgi:capsular exopolysaccharide synthesis family protein
VVGASTATVQSRLGRRLRGPKDLESQLGAPLLATVPRTRRPAPGSGSASGPGAEDIALVTVAVPDGPAAEAYRRLRARILTMTDRFGLKTVMVASPTVEGGSAVIAANLAVSVAATGRRVALVGADLRSPGLHTYFGLGNDRGLSDVLAGQAAPSDVAQEPPGLDTLRVVPAGPPVTEPAALVEAGPMRVVLEERAEVSDFVVVEAPPALSAAESLTMAPMVDGIVVVADARHATREDLAEVGEQLRRVGGHVLGAVLTNAYGWNV